MRKILRFITQRVVLTALLIVLQALLLFEIYLEAEQLLHLLLCLQCAAQPPADFAHH